MMQAVLEWLDGFATGWDALSPRAAGIGDFVFFKLVNDYLNAKVEAFGIQTLGNFTDFAVGISLTLFTLWILLAGYRIVTGQSRESMIALTTNSIRIVAILVVAGIWSNYTDGTYRLLVTDLDAKVHGLLTGDSGRTSADAIDENLVYMQVALNAIDAVQIVDGDQQMQDEKARALLFAGFGTASPPMTAGAMLLLYKFTIAMFIGFGPLFILCLIFDQTKDLFRKWLMYGIGTLFSMAMLSVVTAIALELAVDVAKALWMAKLVNGILGTDTEGLTSQAMQQGGIGLLLTVLIVTVPPAAAMFFQGTIANLSTTSAFASTTQSGGTGARSNSGYEPPQPRMATQDARDRGPETLPGLAVRTQVPSAVTPSERVRP